MNLIFDSEHVKVYDDVLPEEDFEMLFEWFNIIPFINIQRTESVWNHVWNPDAKVLKGQPIYFPAGRVPPLDGIDKSLIAIIEKINSIINEVRVTMTPYYYMPGSGLKWHNDRAHQKAFTFYCHKSWSPEWGGEFQTIDMRGEERKMIWKVFDNKELFDAMISKGIGQFFHPKPNRLIVNSNIMHKINTTSTDSSARLSLQGFIA